MSGALSGTRPRTKQGRRGSGYCESGHFGRPVGAPETGTTSPGRGLTVVAPDAVTGDNVLTQVVHAAGELGVRAPDAFPWISPGMILQSWARRTVGLGLLLGVTAGSAAPARRYRLEAPVGERQASLRLVNSATGKTVWTRTAVSVHGAYWSSDRRAVAILDDRSAVWPNRDWYYRLILWREGERVRTFDCFPPLAGADVNTWIRWSPDKERFLLHESSVQGDADTGQGNQWCVHTAQMRSHLIRRGDATRAEWLDGSQVRYWIGTLELHGANAGLKESAHRFRCSGQLRARPGR